MTVSTAYSVLSYAGNGATTAFSVTWPFFTGTLVVTLVSSAGAETVQTLTTHYTVSGGTDANGLPATGTVTMLTAPASGETLRITRSTTKTQASTWTESDPFPQKTVEAALDKLTLLVQEAGSPGTVNDGIGGDVMELVSSGATDYWDAESQIIRNVADGTATNDAVNYGQLQAYQVTAGAGDVVGPASSTDGSFAVFNSTTGKIISQPDNPMLIPQGRLTLTTSEPVMTGTVASTTLIKYVPYVGNRVPLWDGTSWTLRRISDVFANTTSDATKNPAACTTNSNYDLFVWWDNGTLRLSRGPAWASDTSRGTGAGTTELERRNGLLVNKVAISNGPAANYGTYVGTIRTNASSQVEYTLGGLAAGGTAGLIGVWNAYHRAPIAAEVRDSTDSWSYTTTSFRESDNSTAMRVSYVSGIDEDALTATFLSAVSNSGGNLTIAGLGYDSTTLASGTYEGSASSTVSPVSAKLARMPGLGFHYVQALERGAAGATFYGDNGAGTAIQTGLQFYWRA